MSLSAIVLAITAAVIVGIVIHKAWVKYAPSEKALALKAGIKAVDKLASLKSTAPEDLANAAATQAHEAALTQSFKDSVAKLT